MRAATTTASSSSGFDLPAAGKAVVSAVDSVGAHVSWEDPVYTGFLLLSFVLFYAVFIWMQVSFPVFVLYATLFGFLASGAAKLAKDKFQKSVPMLPLPAPDADRKDGDSRSPGRVDPEIAAAVDEV